MGGQTKITKRLCAAAIVALLIFACPRAAQANPISAVGKVVAGVLQVPVSIIVGTFSGPPIIGTLLGTANGLLQGTAMVAGGVLELGMDGIALAKMAAPYVLPFVL